jgi:hypothetical protein
MVTVGAVVSIVMLSPPEAALVFPAESVAFAVMLYVPAARAAMVLLQLPLPSAVVVPRDVLPPLNSSTVLLASAVPVKVGVLMFVMLSVFEDPESLAAVRSGVDGAAGPLVSIVTLRADESGETFPAASVAVAVILCVPEDRALTVIPGLP